MRRVKVKEARARLSALLDQVAAGEEIILTRRGKETARLVPPRSHEPDLPSLEDFRASLEEKGEPLSLVVVRSRREERY